jgi:hypothetical protein
VTRQLITTPVDINLENKFSRFILLTPIVIGLIGRRKGVCDARGIQDDTPIDGFRAAHEADFEACRAKRRARSKLQCVLRSKYTKDKVSVLRFDRLKPLVLTASLFSSLRLVLAIYIKI